MTIPHPEWIKCPDCASTVHIEHPEPGVMNVEVEHSPTCPAWQQTGREVVLAFLPKGDQ